MLNTLDTLLVFTSQGNYFYIPVYKIVDVKWKDLGDHLSSICSLDKGKNERITFTLRPDAKFDASKIPEFLKKHKDTLSFTAYGNPFFTLKVKKTGVIELDAQNYLMNAEKLLEEMKELLISAESIAE